MHNELISLISVKYYIS